MKRRQRYFSSREPQKKRHGGKKQNAVGKRLNTQSGISKTKKKDRNGPNG